MSSYLNPLGGLMGCPRSKWKHEGKGIRFIRFRHSQFRLGCHWLAIKLGETPYYLVSYPAFLMAAPEFPDQCARAAGGGLLDASDIVFYNDVDDDTPLPNSKTTSTPLHPFFQGPGNVGAGSRRSARVTRPSARITDPDNIAAPATTQKQPATATAPAEASLHVARRAKVINSNEGTWERHHDSDNATVDLGDDNDIPMADASTEGGDATTEAEDGGDHTDVEIVEEAYLHTKAMGNADRQVCLTSLVQVRGE